MIQQQLFAGAKASSGTNWSGPVEKAIAHEQVERAETLHLLATLGLGALSAAAFILAEFATAGMATFVMAGIGMGISAGQAATSWSKYSDLSTAAAATVQPELAIVDKEQVDSALLTAILDTAFVFLDGAGAVAGGGRSRAKAGRGDCSRRPRRARRSRPRCSRRTPRTQGHPPGWRRRSARSARPRSAGISGKSYAELAEIAGKEKTEPGASCSRWSSSGRRRAAKAAVDAAAKLPNLAAEIAAGTLTQEEANKVALDAIDSPRPRRARCAPPAAGRSSLSAVGDGPAGQALEGWRRSHPQTSSRTFVAKETEEATKAVRTGTKELDVNDLDVQAVGGEASLMADKANKWLAGARRLQRDRAQDVLDATVFVDPTRAHLFDVAKGLDPADRAAIMAKQAGYDKQFIFAARLHEAQAKGDAEAIARITAEAQAVGVTPWKGFKPLSGEEAKILSGQVDGLGQGARDDHRSGPQGRAGRQDRPERRRR